MTDMLRELNERIKTLGGDWSKYAVVGSFLLYVVGYLTLRFHLTALGLNTDLAVLDERYLFAGAHFLIMVLSSVPSIFLICLPLVVIYILVPRAGRERMFMACNQRPNLLAGMGILFSLLVIQLAMRKSFFIHDILLSQSLPKGADWLNGLLLEPNHLLFYFYGLLASCVLPLVILCVTAGCPPSSRQQMLRGVLIFLTAIQVLMLPVNYGTLMANKSLPRVASVGGERLPDGEEAWLVWEGKDGFTFLHRNVASSQRMLVTLPRAEVKRIEIIGSDHIVTKLFGTANGGRL